MIVDGKTEQIELEAVALYYTQFSEALPLESAEEKEWFEKRLGFCPKVAEHNPEHYNAQKEPVSVEAKFFDECVSAFGGNGEEFEFECRIEKDEIWFYSEDCGSPYQVAYVVHRFLQENRSSREDEFVIRWSDSCSKLRVGAFLGGTMVASKLGVGVCGPSEQEGLARTLARMDPNVPTDEPEDT